MRVGICDDDAIWCRKAEKIIYSYAAQTETELEVICFTTSEKLNSYDGYPLDMLFMDIVLENEEGKNGIDIVTAVNKKWKDCQIVYLTNYLFYATEVYHTEIGGIFGKVFHQLAQTREKLVYSVIGGKEVSLAPADILYFERSGRITNIITVYGTYSIWDKLSVLTEGLPTLDFVRCHNSYIVYLPAVREMLPDVFLMNDGREVTISRSYRKIAKAAFMKWAVTQMS